MTTEKRPRPTLALLRRECERVGVDLELERFGRRVVGGMMYFPAGYSYDGCHCRSLSFGERAGPGDYDEDEIIESVRVLNELERCRWDCAECMPGFGCAIAASRGTHYVSPWHAELCRMLAAAEDISGEYQPVIRGALERMWDGGPGETNGHDFSDTALLVLADMVQDAGRTVLADRLRWWATSPLPGCV